ncbi:MAG: glycosyltransferase family 2 protein [Gemmataceae bacterium]
MTTPSPDVAVIVASHSRPGPLDRVLASVARQRGVAVETIVADNPSEKSAEIEAVVAARPKVQLVKLAHNRGFGRAINQGVERSSAPLLYFACDDVELADDCLAELCRAHRARPAAGMTAPVIYDAADTSRVRCAGGDFRIGLKVRLDLFRQLPQPAAEEPYQVSFVPGGAALIDRELFTQLGRYRDDFFMYEEDTELSQRVRRAGRDLAIAPRARTYDLIPPSTYDPKVVRPDMIRNHLATVLLHAPAALVPVLFGTKFAAGVVRLPGLPSADRRHWVVGWKRFLVAVPRLLRDRARNAQTRRAMVAGRQG